MTLFGFGALLAGGAALTLGLSLDWLAFDLLGLGLLAVVALGLAAVVRPSRLVIDREIQPPRVPKGSPAIAFLSFANRGRRSVPLVIATQPFGSHLVRTVIPRLRGGERGTRAYRLPTRERGIFDVQPVEVTRRDPFELFRVSRRHGRPERIWVYPRVLAFRTLPAGQVRHLEGPSSETSPQGNITFHRLREYVAGDDLRLIHWRSSAHAGRLLVKHNVDTSQPYSIVLLDQRPSRYAGDCFEQAVDVAASVLVACAADKAPVELRLTDGTVVGGRRVRAVTPLIDHLTGIRADPAGSLRAQLLQLRRGHGGTTLVIVTGVLDRAELADAAALRRRFERLVVLSVDSAAATPADFPGLRVIAGTDADEVRAAWNMRAHS